MKRFGKKIIYAFLISILAINVFAPLRAQADPAGEVTIHGQITFQPRNYDRYGMMYAGREMQIDLFEKDHTGTEYLLQSTYTNWNGEFSFLEQNYWGPSDPKLNIFYRVRMYYPNTGVYPPPIPPASPEVYYFDSGTHYLSRDGDWSLDFAINQSCCTQDYRATWIFEDLRNAWDYVFNHDVRNGIPYDPGDVTAYWAPGTICYAFCASYSLTTYIFISDPNIYSMDTSIHETGHKFMAYAGWWYGGSDCWVHYINQSSSAECAYTEGWADFFAMAVNGDQCYTMTRPYACDGTADYDYYNLELHSRLDDDRSSFNWGETVEGRVAATLYDLYDSINELFDEISAGFAPISQIALQSAANHHPFSQFWNTWLQGSGQDAHNSGITFWWNTINFANIQQIFLAGIQN